MGLGSGFGVGLGLGLTSSALSRSAARSRATHPSVAAAASSAARRGQRRPRRAASAPAQIELAGRCHPTVYTAGGLLPVQYQSQKLSGHVSSRRSATVPSCACALLPLGHHIIEPSSCGLRSRLGQRATASVHASQVPLDAPSPRAASREGLLVELDQLVLLLGQRRVLAELAPQLALQHGHRQLGRVHLVRVRFRVRVRVRVRLRLRVRVRVRVRFRVRVRVRVSYPPATWCCSHSRRLAAAARRCRRSPCPCAPLGRRPPPPAAASPCNTHVRFKPSKSAGHVISTQDHFSMSRTNRGAQRPRSPAHPTMQRGRKERSGEEAVRGEDQMCCHARVSRAMERAAASVAAAELRLVVAAMNHPGSCSRCSSSVVADKIGAGELVLVPKFITAFR